MSTSSFCPNCYHPSPGEYCPQCGQKQAERRESVHSLVHEFLDEQFGVNRRLPRTIKLLLFKPGLLTAEYFNGRVQQYISPFRLYLLTSVIFFALFALSQSAPVKIEREESVTAAINPSRNRPSAAQTKAGDSFIGFRMPAKTTGNWVRDVEVNFVFPPLTRAAQKNLDELALLGEAEATGRIVRTVVAQIPKVFFAFLPLYALLLFMFFFRQRKYYVEHFIFSLHLHSFAFIALLPLSIFDMPFLARWVRSLGDLLSIFIMLWVFIHIFMALRRVYGQSRLVTAVKYFFLWILYTMYFVVGVLVAAVLALTTG